MKGPNVKCDGRIFRTIQMYVDQKPSVVRARIRIQFVAYCNNVRRVHFEVSVRSTEMLADWMITWNDDGIVPNDAVSYH